ncbi:hypothetical protein SCHPADRAFT_889842 [Schizopora paradoxa]|uniref:Uncharacterized protein n=1 Tax=Schizopora paradoxa TaxID=27342 RepID=A0A0H2RNS2_9AGAM|nr:hypothetical protein SCHPADRAFT_889842 [Schizopora paradoxa]
MCKGIYSGICMLPATGLAHYSNTRKKEVILEICDRNLKLLVAREKDKKTASKGKKRTREDDIPIVIEDDDNDEPDPNAPIPDSYSWEYNNLCDHLEGCKKKLDGYKFCIPDQYGGCRPISLKLMTMWAKLMVKQPDIVMITKAPNIPEFDFIRTKKRRQAASP